MVVQGNKGPVHRGRKAHKDRMDHKAHMVRTVHKVYMASSPKEILGCRASG